MGYRFPLQRILDTREEIAKECEMRFEALVQKIEQLRELLMAERNLYLTERDELNEAVRISKFESMRVYELSLDTRKKRMMQVLEILKAVEEEKYLAEQDLIRARRDVKVIEKYKDKKSTEYEVKIEKAERKSFDEQATSRYVHESRRESKG